MLQKIATALLLTLPLTASVSGQRLITLDDVMAIRQVTDPRVSPDGSRVVYTVAEVDMKANTENVDLWLAPTSGGPSRRLTSQPTDDRHPRWSPDGTRIAFLSDRPSVGQDGRRVDRVAQVWLLSIDGGEAMQLTKGPTAVTDVVWSPDSKQVAYVAGALPDDHDAREQRRKAGFDEVVADDHRMRHIWTIEAGGGVPTQITRGDFDATEPAWSPKGDQIAFVSRPTPGANEQLLSDLYLVPASGGSPRKLVTNDGPDFAPAWSPDGSQIAYLSNGRRQSSGAHNTIAMLPVSGGEPRVVLDTFEYSAGAPRWSPDGVNLYFPAGTKTESHIYIVPARGGQPRPLTKGRIVVSGIDVSPQGRLTFLREDPRTPENVWTANADGTADHRITDVNPQIADYTLGDTEVIRWRGADDWEIEGVLVKPVGYQPGRRWPVIVEAHGGPHGAQTVAFNSTWQYYAARGFMVFAPNFRGSSGYRQEFVDADRNDWGGKDYVDIMRGIDHLVAEGLADPERLGIAGWSYGGFMTSWAIGQTDRFKAAVAGAAVTNLQSFYGTTDIQRFIEWEYHGFPWDNAEKIRAHSPITHAHRARTPTLVLHGAADIRVPIEQGAQLYTTLRKTGVTTQFVSYPREGHGLREPAHRHDRINRTVEWMERFLGKAQSVSQ